MSRSLFLDEINFGRRNVKKFHWEIKPCPSIPLFLFYQGKTSNLPRIFSHCRTHKILGKDRENTKITKEIPCLKLTKEILKTKEWKDREGRFPKRAVLANVPSFRFSFPGNRRTYPRSGFRSRGTSECTLVPFFVPGEHPPKPPFWKTTLVSTPENCLGFFGGRCNSYREFEWFPYRNFWRFP